MEYIPILLSAISVIFCIATFVVNRKDKAEKDAKENNIVLVNFRLDEIDKKLDKLIDKYEQTEKEQEIRHEQLRQETDSKIEKAILVHVESYHKRGRKVQ